MTCAATRHPGRSGGSSRPASRLATRYADGIPRSLRLQRVALAPGERRTLSFTLGPGDLAFHDAAMRRVVEPGAFTLFAGGDSVHLRSATVRVTGATTVVP